MRRYSDFYAFHEVISWRFPNRIIPPIPPQKLSALVKRTDSDFAEERRKGLLRWLKIVLTHPIIKFDPAVEVSLFTFLLFWRARVNSQHFSVFLDYDCG